MLGCHWSQQRWLDSSQGFPSYIVTMHELMAEVGRMSGRYRLAEGWRRHVHYGFCAADADPLALALGPHVLVATRPWLVAAGPWLICDTFPRCDIGTATKPFLVQTA